MVRVCTRGRMVRCSWRIVFDGIAFSFAPQALVDGWEDAPSFPSEKGLFQGEGGWARGEIFHNNELPNGTVAY